MNDAQLRALCPAVLRGPRLTSWLLAAAPAFLALRLAFFFWFLVS